MEVADPRELAKLLKPGMPANPALAWHPALTGAEQYGGAMEPAQRPDVAGLVQALGSARDAMGGPIADRMAQHGAQQQARMASGNFSPTPVTADSMRLADSVAGGLVGPIAMTKAYHGSKRLFDKFSMDHVGSGDGGAMLGRGIHFSSDRGAARQYGPNVYKADLDDSRILDVRKNIEDLTPDVKKRLQDAGVISPPVRAETSGSRTDFKVGERTIWSVEETRPGAFRHFVATGQQARPLGGSSVQEFAAELGKMYPATGPVSQVLDGGQVTDSVARALKRAGFGAIVDGDLSAKSAAGGTRGKPRDVYLVFDEDVISGAALSGKARP